MFSQISIIRSDDQDKKNIKAGLKVNLDVEEDKNNKSTPKYELNVVRSLRETDNDDDQDKKDINAALKLNLDVADDKNNKSKPTLVRSVHRSIQDGNPDCTAPNVAFTAKLPWGKQILGTKETVRYTKVLVNENSDYDVRTGVFTTSEPGIYLFNLHAVSAHDKAASLYLCHNAYKDRDERVTSLFVHHGNDNNAGSTSAVLHLQIGDTVEVISERGTGEDNYELDQESAKGNSFSGVLVTSDWCHN